MHRPSFHVIHCSVMPMSCLRIESIKSIPYHPRRITLLRECAKTKNEEEDQDDTESRPTMPQFQHLQHGVICGGAVCEEAVCRGIGKIDAHH